MANGKYIKTIYCSPAATFVTKDDGSVWVTGSNSFGLLGLGHNNNVTELTPLNISGIKKIEAGNSFSFLLKEDGTLYSCGCNNFGQLGIGADVYTEKHSFTKLSKFNGRYTNVWVGGTFAVMQVDGSSKYSCGWNMYGQLGIGSYGANNNKNEPTLISTNSFSDAEVIIGNDHMFQLCPSGDVYACGSNHYGELGLGTTTENYTTFKKVSITNVKKIVCGNGHTVVLKNDGTIWSCGYNSKGELGLGNTTNVNSFTKVRNNCPTNIKDIAVGNRNTFVITEDGNAYSCGRNDCGQLGLGHTNNRDYFCKMQVANVSKIIAGSNHTIAITNDGKVYNVGSNANGELGLGSSITNVSAFAIHDGLQVYYEGMPEPITYAGSVDEIINLLTFQSFK